MICIAGKLPVLQVGRHQVCGYSTDWIREGLVEAAEEAGVEDFPFLDEIYQAIHKYLEFNCSLAVLPVEDLNERILGMLKKIGMEHLCEKLPVLTPPIILSLEWLAKQSGTGFELGFFSDLRTEILSAKEAGVSRLILEEVEPAVSILTGRMKWDKRCKQLKEEIINFVGQAGVIRLESYK